MKLREYLTGSKIEEFISQANNNLEKNIYLLIKHLLILCVNKSEMKNEEIRTSQVDFEINNDLPILINIIILTINEFRKYKIDENKFYNDPLKLFDEHHNSINQEEISG